MTENRMAGRNLREQADQQRRQPTRQTVNKTSALAYLHNAHPERQNTRQAQRNLKSRLGIVERTVHDCRKNIRVPQQKLHSRNEKSNGKKANPNIVENHKPILFLFTRKGHPEQVPC